MFAIIHLLGTFIADLLKSRRRLEVENLFLRHQLNIVLRRSPQRLRLRSSDRALLVWMTRVWPSLLGLARVVQPDTIVRWHRAGFGPIGAGNPRVGREDPGSSVSYVISSGVCAKRTHCGAPRESMASC
jgi:hypothetical protein